MVPRRASRAAPGCAGATTTRRPRSRTSDLVEENRARSKFEPEYELLDTGIFDDDRYWIVEVHYAKASADRHPDADHRRATGARRPPRSTSCRRCGSATSGPGTRRPASPSCRAAPDGAVDPGEPPRARRLRARRRPGPGRDAARRCCSARTRRTAPRIDGVAVDHAVPEGRHQRPRRRRRADGQPGRHRHEGRRRGTGWTCRPARRPSSGCGSQLPTAARGDEPAPRRRAAATARPRGRAIDPLGPSFESTMRRREAEADEFYADLRREAATDDEQRIMRQAFAGMLWSKQYYGYNVARWLDGDPGLPPPPAGAQDRPQRGLAALRRGRHPVDARSRGSTRGSRPGTSRSTRSPSPTSTRPSRSTSCCCCAASGSSTRTARCPPTSGRSTTSTRRSTPRPRYLVWDDRRPARHRVPRADLPQAAASTSPGGSTARTRRATTSSRAASSGLDNIGAFDRSHLPAGAELEQSDATAWMFLYCLTMLRIATVLSEDGPGLRGLPDDVPGARRPDRARR